MKAKICMTMALASVCTMGAAQTQRAIDDIDKEIARLERSDELQTRRADNANAFFNAKLYNQQKAGNRQAPHIQDCKTLYFKYLYEVGDTAAAPLLPKCIGRLERALKRNAGLASQALIHDADPSGISSREIDGLTYAYSDSIGGVTAYSYPLDNLCNYATMTFCGNDSVRTNYMFAWKPQLFTDMESRRVCTIDGYIAKLTGKDWQANSYIDFNESGSEQKVYDVDETERIDTMTGDIAVSQVKMLAEKFRKSMAKGNYKQCDAIAFVMRRLAEKFDGTLTTEQYDSIKRNIWSMEETGNSQRNKALMRTVSAFRRKTEQKTEKPYRSQSSDLAMSTRSRLGKRLCPPEEFMVVSEFMGYPQMCNDEPTIAVRIIGTAADEDSKIFVGGLAPDKTFAVPTDKRGVRFCKDRVRNSLICITDGSNTYYAFADTVTINVDMRRGITSASETNMKLMAVQDSLKAFDTEAIKYSTTIDGRLTVTDSAGFARLMRRLDNYVMATIKANSDNAVHLFLLYNYYFRMSQDELALYVDSTGRYASNLLMQPAAKYFNDNEKLKPGTKLADTECWDTDGNKRNTAEFRGDGYTLLYLYYPQNRDGRRGAEIVRQLYDRYGGKGLDIVCHAFTFGFNGDLWRWYIRRNGMEHLTNIFGGNFAALNHVNAMPTAIILDNKGRIVDSCHYGPGMVEKVNRIMENRPTAQRP